MSSTDALASDVIPSVTVLQRLMLTDEADEGHQNYALLHCCATRAKAANAAQLPNALHLYDFTVVHYGNSVLGSTKKHVI